MAASRKWFGGTMTTPKVVKSLHGIALTDPEGRNVCDCREYPILVPFWICLGDSADAVTHVTGSFTGLRPGVDTWAGPYLWR